jgi:nicotinate-nucleotide adenylyltransferase
MVEIAVRAEPGFFVSDLEHERVGPSYSVDTVEQLDGLLRVKSLLKFIIGMDAFAELTTWKKWRELLGRVDLAVAPRPGYRLAMISRAVAQLGAYTLDSTTGCWSSTEYRGKIYPIDMEPLAISSTDIRRKVAVGKSIAGLVPGAVDDYIGRNSLYLD